VKYAWIEAQAGWQPIARLCNVLGVSRSGFLQWRERGPSDRELANRALDAQVAVIHAEGKQGYGRIRVTRRLRQSGMRVGAERVRKSLLRQSLRSVYRKKYRVTTDSNHRKPVAQNLLDRRFDGWSPNQAWTTDITYLLTDEGWLYLAAIVDLGTRRIVGWAMSGRMSAKLVLRCAADGVLASAAGCWTVDALRSWQPIRQRRLPQASEAISHDAIDEPEGKLLGQCANGELLQDA
jgi:putative transposase